MIENIPFSTFNVSKRIQKPILTVILINPDTGAKQPCYSLIDTGASECVFPGYMAFLLGHNLEKGTSVLIDGINSKIQAWMHMTTMVVNDIKIGTAPVYYVNGLEMGLIGERNFLSKFTLEINYPKKIFSIRK